MTSAALGADSPSSDVSAHSPRWSIVALQLLLALALVWAFEFEERRQLFTMLAISIAGFPVYFRVPIVWRSWFFVGLTALTTGLILGWSQSAWAFAVGSSLVGICYLPVALACAGLFVAVNALLDYRQSRKPKLELPSYSVSLGASLVLRSMGTFLLVSFFWGEVD